MANEKHLYLTVGGGYIASATALANETWQFGVRICLNFGSIDPIASLPNNWDVYANPQTNDETSWITSSNWAVDGPGLPTFDPCAYLNDQAGPAAAAFVASTGNFSAAVQLRELRLYPIGSDGKALPAPPFAAGSPALLTYKATQPVGSGSSSMPPQTTAVMSLRTQQVGRRGRGRCYLPMSAGGNVGTTGLVGMMSAAYQAGLATACQTFLEDLGLVALDPSDPQCAPIVTGAPWSSYAAVTSMILDNAWDTQRRRRRSSILTPVSKPIEIG